LKEIDPVAFVRFASVYKSFESLEDFKNFIG
jgi:transcriptional regulator NrdR family protein